MEQKKLNIEDNSGDRKYFTLVPNFILNHSTAIDQAVYLQLKRLTDEANKTICYPSFRYLKKQLGIGEGNLKKSIKYLIEHKWIEDRGKQRIMTAGGYQFVQTYKINDIWKLNMDYYNGVSSQEHLDKTKVYPEKPKVYPKMAKVYPVIGAKEELNKELNKEQRVCFLLKDWNDRQLSPIADFKPENIVNKYGAEKIEEMIKRWGKENSGFSKMLSALKEK